MKKLKQEIATWDGKSKEDIGRVYDTWFGSANFVTHLVDLLSETSVQKGASWLLKKHLESGGELPLPAQRKMLASLDKCVHWETKLHILQCSEYFQVGQAQKKAFEHSLRGCLEDENKFVRAWAYHGFYYLAQTYPEYAEEVKSLFKMAMRDEPASVKARVRNLLKRGFQ